MALTTKSKHYTPFLEAVRGSHRAVCQILLRYGATPGARSMSNETALHIATRAGPHKITPMLISNKISIDWIDRFSESAVHIAAGKGSLSAVEAPIEASAKRSRKNNSGKTALHLPAEGSDRALVEYLLRRGATGDVAARLGETAAELACGAKAADAVDVVKLLSISTPKESVRCLVAAIKANNLDSVRYLLSGLEVDPNGVDPQNADKKQATALHLASARGNVAIVGVLLTYGGSIYARDVAQNTPLHYAVAEDVVDAAKQLLKAGADPDHTNEDGKNAKSLARTMPQAKALLEVLV